LLEVVENPDYETIRSLGWQTEGIVERENLYIVEGDVLLSKAYLDSLRRTPITRQARYEANGRTITGGREDGIRVKISTQNIPDAAWRQAVRDAIDIWNDVPNCSVYFYKIETEILPHEVNVVMDDGPNSPDIADATPPNFGTPGDKIRINPEIAWYNTSHEQKVNILVHEFGHILGLGHSDFLNTSYALCHIEGTPLTDAGSVMVHNTAGQDRGDASSWNGFTQGDLAAIQALYGTPIWSQSISGPGQWLSSSPSTYTLNLGTNLTGLTVSWYVNSYFYQNSTSLSLTPTTLPIGQVTLKAVVNSWGGSYEATKTITAIDDTPPPPSPVTPTISGNKMGTSFRFSVGNHISGATYQWELNGSLVDSRVNGTEMLVNPQGIVLIPNAAPPVSTNAVAATMSARCRMKIGSLTSSWSSTSTL
jgi:hypothetical protein